MDVRCHKVKIVTTRKPQTCLMPYFEHKTAKKFPAGTRMWKETAIVDGQWGSNYVCLSCIDQHIKDYES